MIVICNSSPLVHLSAMRELNLLKRIFGEIRIPEEVYEEVVEWGNNRPGSVEVKTAGWIKRMQVKNHLATAALNTRLGQGESACLILGLELGADLLVLDDHAARLEAQALGLRITGTIGILLKAAKQGMIDFGQALDELLATGFRLSPLECKRVLQLWQEIKHR